MKSLIIHVYPVLKKSVQKRHLTPVVAGQYNSSGEIVGLTDTQHIKPYFRAEGNTPITFLEDSQRPGKFKTGLEEIIPNPLFGLDPTQIKIDYNLSNKWDENTFLERIVKQKDIDRQTYYEILDGQEPRTYHNNIANSMVNIAMGLQDLKKGLNDKSYIGKEVYQLYTHGSNVFTTDTQRGRLAIQCIKNHPSISPDKNSINEAIHDWYIGREDEASHDKAKMNEIVNDAIFELEMLRRKYPAFTLYQFAVQLEDYRTKTPLVKGDVNDTTVMDRLNAYIKNESKWQEENINRFKSKIAEFNEFPDLFQVKYLTSQGIHSGVLVQRDGKFLWVSQINNDRTWAEFKNRETFEQKMLAESKLSLDETNYYVQFEKELNSKGIKTK